MRDVFISYSSQDRERARRYAEAFQARGWDVWWDPEIPPGRQYDEVIVEALQAARCVVVLWSRHSAGSIWVKNEAAEAMNGRKLIPVLIETGVTIPFEFRRVQAANLPHWDGDPAAPAFESLCRAMAALIGAPPGPPRPPEPTPPSPQPAPPASPAPRPTPAPPTPPGPAPSPGRASRRLSWIGAGVLVLLVLAAMWAEDGGLDTATPAPSPPHAATEAPARSLPPGAPIDMPLAWRDATLRYAGRLAWDGRSPRATLQAQAADGATGRPVTAATLDAVASTDPEGRAVFSTQLAVPADSETPMPHRHTLHLVFEPGPGGWTFARSCDQPGRCWPAGG